MSSITGWVVLGPGKEITSALLPSYDEAAQQADRLGATHAVASVHLDQPRRPLPDEIPGQLSVYDMDGVR